MNKKLSNQKVKICFVSLNSYHILIEKNSSYTGGAENQQIGMAKELKKRGYEISFITYGDNHRHSEMNNGLEVISTYKKQDANKLNLLRKMFIIWKKMKEANADIYYYHAGSPGITALFCLLNKKKIITHLASDADVTGENIINNNIFVTLLDKIGIWVDIRLSDKVLSQTSFQKSKLKERFNVDSIIIKNVFDISLHSNNKSVGDYLLWIGAIRSIKQPELFLKIAQYFPEYKFVMIGGEGESSEFLKKIKNAAEKIQNVEFKGFVPPQEIYTYYQKAILLISTSKIEGFPNVFLEAWLYSIPVVSLNVDPDGIIAKYKLGYCSKTFEQMLDNIKRLLNDKKLLKTMGENGRKYVEENHDLKKIANQLENLIENLLNNRQENL